MVGARDPPISKGEFEELVDEGQKITPNSFALDSSIQRKIREKVKKSKNEARNCAKAADPFSYFSIIIK